MNLVAWSNFLGQCLLAFLLVEGVKDVVIGLRTPKRSWWRVGLNLLAGGLVGWFVVPGSGLFPWGRKWLIPTIIAAALVTAGIHRVTKRFRPQARDSYAH